MPLLAEEKQIQLNQELFLIGIRLDFVGILDQNSEARDKFHGEYIIKLYKITQEFFPEQCQFAFSNDSMQFGDELYANLNLHIMQEATIAKLLKNVVFVERLKGKNIIY